MGENALKNKEYLMIVSIFIIGSISAFMVGDLFYFNMFLQSIYATFLLAMAIIIFNTINFNREKISIFLGLNFAIAGIIEGVYIFSNINSIPLIYHKYYLDVYLLFIARLLPVIGILLSFNYLKNSNRSLVEDILKSFIIAIFLTMIANLFLNYILSQNASQNINGVMTGLINNIVIIPIGILSLYKLIKHKEYLNEEEYKTLKIVILLIIASRIPTLIYFITNEHTKQTTVTQLILDIAIYYLYKFIVYTNVKKTYNKLSVINDDLIIKSSKLKENNEQLLRENQKIQQLKEELIKKETKLQSTLDISLNSIVVFDKDKKITYANKSFVDIFGNVNINKMTLEQSMFDKITNLDSLVKNIEEILIYDKKTIKDYVYSKDNNVYQSIFAPLVIGSKKEGVLCILIDKTKKKEFEEKIVQANQRYENFLESIGDGIAVLENQKIIYTNKACNEIFKEQLNSIDFSIQNGNLEKEEKFIVDGKEIYVKMNFSDFYQDKMKRTIVVIRDITNRKMAQLKLKESKKSYSKFIDILPDGICLLDENLNIEYVNKSLVNMLKVETYRQIRNKNIKEILKLSIDKQIIVKQQLNNVFINNKPMILLEHELMCSDKSCVQVEINALPFELDLDKYVMLIVKDLTHKKTSEEAEKELTKRLKTDKIKTEFFANMSHELKTPLNVISSSNQLLDSFYRNGKLEDYNENIKGHIDLVKQSSYRLHRLINNIIDLTKMESGYYNLKYTNGNIVSIIEDLFMAIEEYASKKDISLIFDTDEEEINIAIDKAAIERIMLNLLSNCVKFTPNGGTIFVSINCTDDNVDIKVKDNGVGIPQNKLNLVFEEFAQVDKTLSRNTEGSGIGLSIVRNLVKLHSGNIQVVSSEESGTEFIITLPVYEVESDDYVDIEINNSNLEDRIRLEFSDIYY